MAINLSAFISFKLGLSSGDIFTSFKTLVNKSYKTKYACCTSDSTNFCYPKSQYVFLMQCLLDMHLLKRS